MGDFDPYDTLSFDCYGTLIDWETGIAAALRPWAERHRLALADDELVAAFGAVETVVESEHPTDPYPEILAEVMRRIGDLLGAPVFDAEATAFGASVGGWPVFPDTVEALARLAGRYRLVILSNVDRRSFAASNRRLGVVSTGSSRPRTSAPTAAPAMFDALLAAVEAMGSARSRLLHVAESLYHDHLPAAAAGSTRCRSIAASTETVLAPPTRRKVTCIRSGGSPRWRTSQRRCSNPGPTSAAHHRDTGAEQTPVGPPPQMGPLPHRGRTRCPARLRRHSLNDTGGEQTPVGPPCRIHPSPGGGREFISRCPRSAGSP